MCFATQEIQPSKHLLHLCPQVEASDENENDSPISILCPDLLFKIFSHLKDPNDWLNVSLVSRSWHQISLSSFEFTHRLNSNQIIKKISTYLVHVSQTSHPEEKLEIEMISSRLEGMGPIFVPEKFNLLQIKNDRELWDANIRNRLLTLPLPHLIALKEMDMATDQRERLTPIICSIENTQIIKDLNKLTNDSQKQKAIVQFVQKILKDHSLEEVKSLLSEIKDEQSNKSIALKFFALDLAKTHLDTALFLLNCLPQNNFYRNSALKDMALTLFRDSKNVVLVAQLANEMDSSTHKILHADVLTPIIEYFIETKEYESALEYTLLLKANLNKKALLQKIYSLVLSTDFDQAIRIILQIPIYTAQRAALISVQNKLLADAQFEKASEIGQLIKKCQNIEYPRLSPVDQCVNATKRIRNKLNHVFNRSTP